MIWATDIRYMNDETEYLHARAFIRQMLMERAKSHPARAAVQDQIEKLFRKTDHADVFVASFSEDGDSLPQWRGYSPNGSGVAIGFLPAAINAPILEKPDDDPSIDLSVDIDVCDISLGKCLYSDTEKRKLLNENIEAYLLSVQGKHPKIAINMAPRFLSYLINLCSPIFKDSSFEEEREWRLIVQCLYPDSPKRYFRVGRSTIVPYIKIDVRTNYSTSYIREINVGPTPEPKLASMAIKTLLTYRSLQSAFVRDSIVPYRTW
ncbi:MAG: DUF2971 domain-containing protein [Acidobacteriaceae bacterium]